MQRLPVHGVDEVRVQEGRQHDAALSHVLYQPERLLHVPLGVVELHQQCVHVANPNGRLQYAPHQRTAQEPNDTQVLLLLCVLSVWRKLRVGKICVAGAAMLSRFVKKHSPSGRRMRGHQRADLDVSLVQHLLADLNHLSGVGLDLDMLGGANAPGRANLGQGLLNTSTHSLKQLQQPVPASGLAQTAR